MFFANGEYLEVSEFKEVACESWSWMPLESTRCDGASSIPYIDRETQQQLLSSVGVPGPGARDLLLVRRVFSFDAVQRPAHCELSRCKAVPR